MKGSNMQTRREFIKKSNLLTGTGIGILFSMPVIGNPKQLYSKSQTIYSITEKPVKHTIRGLGSQWDAMVNHGETSNYSLDTEKTIYHSQKELDYFCNWYNMIWPQDNCKQSIKDKDLATSRIFIPRYVYSGIRNIIGITKNNGETVIVHREPNTDTVTAYIDPKYFVNNLSTIMAKRDRHENQA